MSEGNDKGNGMKTDAEMECDGEETWFEDKQHPLLNPYVLEVVFNNFPMVSLRPLAVVCKTWERETARQIAIRKNIIVEFGRFEEVNQYILRRVFNETKDKVTCLTLKNFPSDNNTMFQRIISNLGYFLSTLRIHTCTVHTINLKKIIDEWAPNLEQLDIINGRIRHGQSNSNFLTRRSCVPNLKRLYFHNWRGDVFPTLGDLVTLCPNLIEFCCSGVFGFGYPRYISFVKNSWVSFRKLEIAGMALSNELIMSLTSLELGLTTLNLELPHTTSTNYEVIKNFLTSISNSLRKLTLRIRRVPIVSSTLMRACIPNILFPIEFPQLETLIISPHLLRDFDYLNQCPKLKEMTLMQGSEDSMISRVVCKKTAELNKTVSSLTLDNLRWKEMKNIAAVFANIERLCIILCHPLRFDNETFREICFLFPRITSLTVKAHGESYSVDDSGITGLSNDDVITQLERYIDDGEVDTDTTRKFSYIGNFRSLAYLSLSNTSVHITDASVIFGLSHLPQLCHLDISGSGITDLSLQLLATSFQNLDTLVIQNCANLTEEGIANLKDVRNNLIVVNE